MYVSRTLSCVTLLLTTAHTQWEILTGESLRLGVTSCDHFLSKRTRTVNWRCSLRTMEGASARPLQATVFLYLAVGDICLVLLLHPRLLKEHCCCCRCRGDDIVRASESSVVWCDVPWMCTCMAGARLSLSFSSNDGCAESPSVCVCLSSLVSPSTSLFSLSLPYLLLSLCLAGAYRFDGGGGGGGGCTVPASAAVAVCLCLPACACDFLLQGTTKRRRESSTTTTTASVAAAAK